jgi:hypothetical protein
MTCAPSTQGRAYDVFCASDICRQSQWTMAIHRFSVFDFLSIFDHGVNWTDENQLTKQPVVISKGSHTLVFSICSRALTHCPPTFYIGAKQNPKWRLGQTGQETHRLGSARRADRTANSANANNLGMESVWDNLPTGAPRRAAGAENFWERCRRTDGQIKG